MCNGTTLYNHTTFTTTEPHHHHYSLNGQFQLKENSRIKYYILLNQVNNYIKSVTTVYINLDMIFTYILEKAGFRYY